MQQKKIITFITVFFILGSGFLFWKSENLTDPKKSGNYWAVYFVEPKKDDVDFAIENYSGKTDFRWEILEDGKKISEGDAKVERGDQKNIRNNIDASNGKKIIIQVSSGDEKKDIYKKFEN
jgi:hypothetical protein